MVANGVCVDASTVTAGEGVSVVVVEGSIEDIVVTDSVVLVVVTGALLVVIEDSTWEFEEGTPMLVEAVVELIPAPS